MPLTPLPRANVRNSDAPVRIAAPVAPLDWTEHPDLVDYYSEARNAPEDLYPSERRFLPWLAAGGNEVLDVGCGAGGFAGIWQHFNPRIRYSGVDASAPLVSAARTLHPDTSFVRADCAEWLPQGDAGADVVSALGWLHWEPRYPAAIAELWRVTGRRLFFDVRLSESGAEDEAANQRLALVRPWDGRSTVPYIRVAWPRFARLLLGLGPARVLGHSYRGAPADTVTGLRGPVCFATFVLERSPGRPDGRTGVVLEGPLSWPAELLDRVELLSPNASIELAGHDHEDAEPGVRA